MPRRLASLTVARSDFGRMMRFYRSLQGSEDFTLELAIAGAHYDERLGTTAVDVEASGLPIGLRLPRAAASAGEQAAVVLHGMAAWLEADQPDALVLLGDRYEMLAAAQAATLTRTPVIHIGGGHLTLGAMDERIRHAISKLSALHWVASDRCRDRVVALGEPASRVTVTGAPELDDLVAMEPMSREAFCRDIDLAPDEPFLLCTFHPETNVDMAANAKHAELARLVLVWPPVQVLITAPCADPGHEPFLALCEELPSLRSGARYVPNLGLRRYVSALQHASVMVGNSSSGLIEAATAGLPVVNVGARQEGRDRAENVIDCGFDALAMEAALRRALSDPFRVACRNVRNPYGDGSFVPRAMAALRELHWPLPVEKRWTAGR